MSVIILLSGVFRVNNQGRQFWGLEGPDRDNCNKHAVATVVVVYTGRNFGAISAYTLVHLLHLLIVQQYHVSSLSLCMGSSVDQSSIICYYGELWTAARNDRVKNNHQ